MAMQIRPNTTICRFILQKQGESGGPDISDMLQMFTINSTIGDQ